MRCKSSHWSGAAVAASSSSGGSRARGTCPHGLAAAVARGDGSFSLLPTVGSLSRHPPSAPERPRKVAAGRECASVRCDMQRHQREPGEHEGRMIDAETTVVLGSPGGCQRCGSCSGCGRDTRPVSHQADHADRAVPGGRERRSPVPGVCGSRVHASRPAGDHRQQAGRQRHAGPGDDGRQRQARRLHDRPDRDPRVPRPLHAEGDVRSGQGLHLRHPSRRLYAGHRR